MIDSLIQKISGKENLTRAEAAWGMDEIMSGTSSHSQIAQFLIGLKEKGEAVTEVAGFVDSMRRHALRLTLSDSNAVDGCGTGGDGSHSFNISTAAALVAASAGATVAKHGNRSVSSKCGSADLLEATGMAIDPGEKRVLRSIEELKFGFMFAPRFHPAMKHATAVRKELGVRTVFNILGPMTNPAGVTRQIIGVYDRSLMPLIADVMELTGSKHVLVLHGRDGLDEFSVSAITDYIEIKDGKRNSASIEPTDAGLIMYPKGALAGGDASANLSILEDVLNGKKSACRDAAIFNAGAMLYVAGHADSIGDGTGRASEAIDSGDAREKLNAVVAESVRVDAN
ncbi:MAG: anthranilate phosphoribosyltransferase [candidate division Zixibacteria bacterium]|nr:anthranilate phosphoribosyltransferase [candidate division Zixibacteria bacterium]